MTRFEIKQGLSKLVAYEAIESKAMKKMKEYADGTREHEAWKRAKNKASLRIAELIGRIYGTKEEVGA